MPDDKTIRGPEDPTKININQSWELDYWSNKFGVSKQKIINAVEAVGPLVKKVKSHLGL